LTFSIIDSVLCALLDAVLNLLPADAAQSVQHLIGCLPTSFGTALDLAIPFELQLVLTCNFEKLEILRRLLRDVLAELREIVAFLNTFGQGFIFRNTAAKNQACAGDLNLANAVAAAALALGLPGPAAAGLAGVAGAASVAAGI
jgi:hypothetical protein